MPPHMQYQVPEYCIDAKSGDCPSYCPTTCSQYELTCPGGFDSNGCQLPDFCHYSANPPVSSSDHCPPICQDNEMICFGGFDQQTGWALPDFCHRVDLDS